MDYAIDKRTYLVSHEDTKTRSNKKKPLRPLCLRGYILISEIFLRTITRICRKHLRISTQFPMKDFEMLLKQYCTG